MNAVFSAALLVAALAPWSSRRARGGCRSSYVPLARMARTFLSAGVVTLLAGGLAWLALSQASMDVRATALAAGGVALCLRVAGGAGQRAARPRAAGPARPRPRSSGCPTGATWPRRASTRGSSGLATRDARQHALLTLFAAGPLTRHALGAQARRQLERILRRRALAPRGGAAGAAARHDLPARGRARGRHGGAGFGSVSHHAGGGRVDRPHARAGPGGLRRREQRSGSWWRRAATWPRQDPALAVQRDTIEAHALAAEG
jgi:hypothetical protein